MTECRVCRQGVDSDAGECERCCTAVTPRKKVSGLFVLSVIITVLAIGAGNWTLATVLIIILGLSWPKTSDSTAKRRARSTRQRAAAARVGDLIAGQPQIPGESRSRLVTLAVAGDMLAPLLADGALEEQFGDHLGEDLDTVRSGLGGVVDELRERAVVIGLEPGSGEG